ncbi:MAG TPA: hypothetical protein VFN68_07535 [Acidimicrobiales bacterium]|nr:hypothetical protein [Acidimicrobiales bacterium]
MSTYVRVGNASSRPLTVAVSIGRVGFGDDGRATVSDQPDPSLAGRVHLGETTLTVPAGSYVQDPVAVSFPAGTAPDDYYLGLVVTPRATGSGAVKVVTRLAALIDLDVPGPRHSLIRLRGVHLPAWVLGGDVPVSMTVENAGRSFATVWGEIHYRSLFGAEKVAAFPGRFVVAPGRQRTLAVTVHPGLGAGPVHIDSIVFYNRTPSAVAEISRTATVWWIDPSYLPLIPFGIAAAGVAWRLGRRRARRQQMAPALARP